MFLWCVYGLIQFLLYLLLQIQRSVWISHGNCEDIEKELRLEKIREKLSDRQMLVLTFVEQRKEEYGLNTNSSDVVENLNDEFNSKTKALSTLKQLESKKLLKSNKKSFPDRGVIIFFFPSE